MTTKQTLNTMDHLVRSILTCWKPHELINVTYSINGFDNCTNPSTFRNSSVEPKYTYKHITCAWQCLSYTGLILIKTNKNIKNIYFSYMLFNVLHISAEVMDGCVHISKLHLLNTYNIHQVKTTNSGQHHHHTHGGGPFAAMGYFYNEIYYRK